MGAEMKRRYIVLCCGMFLLTVSGCSALYKGFQMSARERCYQLTYPEQEQCLQENDLEYDEYLRLRKNPSERPKQAN